MVYIGYHQLFVHFNVGLQNFQTWYILVIISCLFHFNVGLQMISNTTTESDSIANGIKMEPEEGAGAHRSVGCF